MQGRWSTQVAYGGKVHITMYSRAWGGGEGGGSCWPSERLQLACWVTAITLTTIKTPLGLLLVLVLSLRMGNDTRLDRHTLKLGAEGKLCLSQLAGYISTLN